MSKKVKPSHGKGMINRFEPGESGNPKGRPRKLVNSVLKDLEDQGFEPVKPAEIVQIYERLLNVTEKEITALVNDKEAPYSVRLVAAAMTAKGKGFEIIERMIDRAHGRPKSEIELGGKLEPFLLLMKKASANPPPDEGS